MARLVAPGLALVLLCAAVAGPVGTAATASPNQGQGPGPLFGATQGEFDRTEFILTVYANGSARWKFQFKKELANESEREQFEDFAAQFNNQSDPELFVNFKDRAESLTRQGTNVTGREMDARDFHKRAYVTDLGNQGVVEMTFLWTNFAAQKGDRVGVGDVFEGGFYIGSNQRLLFFAGPDLVFKEVKPNPDDQEVASLADSAWIQYEGERQFAPGRPQVVFGPLTAGTSTSPASPASPTSPGGPGPSGGFGMLPWIALALVVLLGLGGAAAYRSGAFPAPGGGGDGGDGGPGAAAEPGTTGGATEPAVPDEELLSDEDRVMQLLEENGGRMKQVNIVEETGWSKSKVSMLLSEMEDEDQVSKLRVGRENIISLKGEEPDAAGSPFGTEDEREG